MIAIKSSKVSDKWLEPICSWTTSSVTCILPGTKTKSGSPGVTVKFTSNKRPWEPSPSWGVWRAERTRRNIWEFKVMISSHQGTNWKYCMPLGNLFFCLSCLQCVESTHFSDKDDKKLWPLWFAPDKRPKYCCSAFSCISPKTLKSNQKCHTKKPWVKSAHWRCDLNSFLFSNPRKQTGYFFPPYNPFKL